MMAGVAILLLITLLLQSPVISFNYFTILISFIFLRNGLGCGNVLIMPPELPHLTNTALHRHLAC